jgi:DNA-binding Lrp family transcriptional regulator
MKDKESLIAAAGFSGASSERTWKERMKKLEELGFIKTAPGVGCVLILNPHIVLKRLKETEKRPELETALYNRIKLQMINYKCLDFREKIKLPVPPPVPSIVPPKSKT